MNPPPLVIQSPKNLSTNRVKDTTEHYILRENIYEKNESEEEKEENEEEKFQLLSFFCHMVNTFTADYEYSRIWGYFCHFTLNCLYLENDKR